MDEVSRTLYIPLYGKAHVSRNGIILSDPWMAVMNSTGTIRISWRV